MAQPTNRPEWASTTATLLGTGQTNKVQPSVTVAQVGMDLGQFPACEEDNWWRANVYEWINWIVDEKFPAIDSALADPTPRGTVQAYAFSAPPAGWLVCDGSALDALSPHQDLRTDLINAGFPFGQDGSSNPFIPDLRGEFIRGADEGRGVDTGRVFGSSQTESTKDYYTQFDPNITQDFYMKRISTPTWTANRYAWDTSGDKHQSASSNRSIGLQVDILNDNEVRPRNVAMNYIIKA